MSIPIALALALLFVHLPCAIWLAFIDGYEHRLPNKLVLLISGLTLGTTLGFAWLSPTAEISWLTPLLISLIVGFFAILVALFMPGSIGMGDAKLLPSTIFVSLLLGPAVLFGAIAWICLASILISLIVFASTSSLKSRFAFGPVLLSAPYGGVLLEALGVVAW